MGEMRPNSYLGAGCSGKLLCSVVSEASYYTQLHNSAAEASDPLKVISTFESFHPDPASLIGGFGHDWPMHQMPERGAQSSSAAAGLYPLQRPACPSDMLCIKNGSFKTTQLMLSGFFLSFLFFELLCMGLVPDQALYRGCKSEHIIRRCIVVGKTHERKTKKTLE